MTHSNLNILWYQRILQTATVVTLVAIIIYILPSLGIGNSLFETSWQVNPIILGLGSLTIVQAVVFNLRPPQKHQSVISLATFGLLLISTSAFIFTTGGIYSSLMALWLPAVIFAGIFGVYGLIPAMLAPLLYLFWLYQLDALTPATSLAVISIGEVPLIMSYFIFTRFPKLNQSQTYEQLVSEFSEVSSKAEVVINAISNGVVAIDNKGIVQLINPAAQHMIGWDRRDAVHLHYKSVLKMSDKEDKELTDASDPIAQALAINQEIRTDELKLTTSSERKLLASLVISPVGQLGSGVIVVFRDITKEKAEEREQAEFISTASHEMRTPVASIEGYLGLALNPSTAQIDDKAREYITKAQEVAAHLGRLFQDLLDVSRAEDGRLNTNPKAVELVSFVGGIVEGLQPKSREKGLSMIFKPAPEEEESSNRQLSPVYYVNVDNDHLMEVVSNLVENAIKYTPSGTVVIDITGNEKSVQISVEDTGLGIPTEDLPHLFQKFYRVDNSDTREIGGTGLGLYLCRRLVETMHGRIWAESQYRKGSVFNVEIPRISHQEAMQLIEATGSDDNEQAPGFNMQPESFPAETSFQPAVASPAMHSTAPTTPPVTGAFTSPSASQIADELTISRQMQNQAASAGQAQFETPTENSPLVGHSLADIEKDPIGYINQINSQATSSENQN